MTKQVAKKETGQVAGYDYGELSGIGMEDVKQSDLSIPFINILQSNSPAVEDEIDGAKPGRFINSVTGEIFDDLVVLPIMKYQQFVEWVPREKGGGLVGYHAPDSDVVKKAISENGGDTYGLTLGDNQLTETFYMYVMQVDPETMQPSGFGLLSFTATKIKPYRNWLTSIYMITPRPPLFAAMTRIGTVKQKNEKGSFFNFDIKPAGENWKSALVNPAEHGHLLQEARNFAEMINEGRVTADFEGQAKQEKTSAGGDENMPF